jgi:hypothetical protein
MKKPINFSDERFNDHNINWSFQKRDSVFSYIKETKNIMNILFEKIGELFTYSRRLRRKKI